MTNSHKLKVLIGSLLLSSMFAASIHPSTAKANAFFSWKTVNLAWNDVLNIRKRPSSETNIVGTILYNDTLVSLTGVCTNEIELRDLGQISTHELRLLVRYEWCEVVRDLGEGGLIQGWVYGKYIQPNK